MATTTSKAPNAKAQSIAPSKKELIEKVKELATGDLWIDRLSKDKAWSGLSNSKLLRLHSIFTEAKKRFSSRSAVIDAIVEGEGRNKDADYKKHFAEWPLPRLMDRLGSVEKAVKKAAKKSAAAKKVEAPAKKAEPVKAEAAKKPAAKKAAKKS